MSIFNDAYSNDFRARFAKLTAEEIYTKNDDTGEYFRVMPGGGGGGGDLPYYLKNNNIKIDDHGTPGVFTNVDQNSVDVNNTAGNTGSSLTSTALTFGDSGGNTVLAKPGVNAANNLSTAILGAVNIGSSANQSLILWDSGDETLKRSNIIKLSSSVTDYNTLTPNGFYINNDTSLAKIQGNNFAMVNGSRKLVNITSGGVTVATSTATTSNFMIDNTQPSTTLGTAGVYFNTPSTTYNLLKEDAIVTNQLKALTAATPVGTSKMVTFNTATSAFAHADIPSAAPVAPKTYFKSVTVADFPAITDTHNAFVASQERAVKTYTLGDDEKIIFDFGGATQIKYGRWYVVGLAMENAGLKSIIKAAHVPYRLTDIATTVHCCYVGGTAFTTLTFTVQPYHIAFRVEKAGKTVSDNFTGYIEFHKVLHDSSTAPTITPT